MNDTVTPAATPSEPTWDEIDAAARDISTVDLARRMLVAERDLTAARERIAGLEIYGKIADAQVSEIANLQKRVSEFDTCIHKVAAALGACCGGVDGDQADPHSTTAVLLRHISELKPEGVVVPRDSDAMEHLRELVTALEGSFISSWQTTAGWQKQLDAASEFLAAAPDAQKAKL